MVPRRVLAWLAAILLIGCTPAPEPSPAPTATTVPSPTPRPPLETLLREAFRQPDITLRQEQVLAAADAFLRDPAIQTADDNIASTYFTDIAFSSGRMTLPQPAIIRRQSGLAIVSLPEGMGLYLFDLAAPPGTSPVRLSPWTVNLDRLEVTWQEAEAGIQYVTRGLDGLERPHFVLARQQNDRWQVTWFSDEEPDWWFNAVGGTLRTMSNLSELSVTGAAEDTTSTFYEQDDEPRRTFRLLWERELSGYRMTPATAAFDDRREWYWAVAVPSPYATLVEFLERLEIGDRRGAATLTTNDAVMQAASDFGLENPERRYQLASVESERLIFRDVQAAFVATFQAPEPGGKWLITSIVPYGAPSPSSTPTVEPVDTP